MMKHFIYQVALGASLFLLPVKASSAETELPKSNKPSPGINSLFPDKVVAKGKGFEVMQSEVDEAYITFKANRAATGQPVPRDTMRAKIEAEILDKLIATKLCLSRASEADRAKGKETADQFITEQMKQASSEESFNRQLVAVGMTPEKFRSQILEQGIVKAVLDREIRVQKTVTEAAAREFYDKNISYFQEPEAVRVSHILFSTQDMVTGYSIPQERRMEKKRLADKVLARAREGEDFAALVKEFSDDAPSKDNGGDYTLFRSSNPTVPEFEAAAFSLRDNQISDVVASRFGYHLIKLKERTPPRAKDFSQVEARIKEILLQEEVQKELPNYIEKLKKEAGVEILSRKANG
jgi:peptidyl-prolyl cis-trans isomerase C